MRKTVSVLAAVGLVFSSFLSSVHGFFGQEDAVKAVQSEEAADYYRKWLAEDVVYIISDEERAVFDHLATPEEKETFIEQFWFRRDPDPRSAANEFKEEHYRRIAYANEMYACGKPGWKTDRGRIYIIHGPPNEIQSHPSGGSYQRPSSEGGGTTVAYPFETWRYRNIEGLGDDIILEFVDQDYTGTYNLSHMPEDKDALLLVPGAGPTLAEEAGMATRGQRPIFAPGSRDLYPMMTHGYRDNPFYRYEVYSRVQAPQTIRYKDLQELVKVEVDYSNLPVMVREDYYRLNNEQVLVPITIQIQNKDLTFEEKESRQVAQVAVYGLVTGLTNRVALEFDDDLVTALRPADFQAGLRRSSIYQKVIPLDRKMRYKMDIVAKDLNSGHVGVVRRAIVPPTFDDGQLISSSLILADSLQVLEDIPDSDEMFVLGDVKVRPNLKKEFFTSSALSVYLQLYNAGVDQTTMKPELNIRYRLLKQGQVIHEIVDDKGSSIQFYSSQRIVLVRSFALEGLPDGDYQMEVIVKDLILQQSLQVIEHFHAVSG